MEPSKIEIAEKIVHLHDIEMMGFRKIVKKLNEENIRINKDKANQIYRKFKSNIDLEIGIELRQLRKRENNSEHHLIQQKEKEKIRQNLTRIYTERNTLTYDQRKILFTNPKKLLTFAGKSMSVLQPIIWDEFFQFCEERGYDLANSLANALGKQKIFEEQIAADTDVWKLFILHFKTCMEKALKERRLEEENTNQQEKQPSNKQHIIEFEKPYDEEF